MIELQPSGVINRFRVTKDFPKDDKTKDSIIATLHERIEERERDDMARIQQVIDLITANKCISLALAEHFGDADCVPDAGCGNCSFVSVFGASNCHCRDLYGQEIKSRQSAFTLGKCEC